MDWKELKDNPEKWTKVFARQKAIAAIREFFNDGGFQEIETPSMVSAVIPEPYLDIFSTDLIGRDGKKKKMFLIPSPEVSIKKLLAAGLGDCFEISRSFRNRETGSPLHNPEFSMLEWYRVGADYRDLMDDCEKLFARVCKDVVGSLRISYQGKDLDMSSPWERISVSEALERYAGISLDEISYKSEFPLQKMRSAAEKKGYEISGSDSWEQIFNLIFLNEIEPRLGVGRPTIIYDYPKPLAALAKFRESDPRLAERFEVYAAGLELGDGYTELTDPKEQEERFEREMGKMAKGENAPVEMDRDFLAALRSGLPACAGFALGVDRLAMLLTDSSSIDEIRPFAVKLNP